MSLRTVYVGWTGKRWMFWRRGARRATKLFDTRGEAIKFGRAIAKRDGVPLSIHDKNGEPESRFEPPNLGSKQ